MFFLGFFFPSLISLQLPVRSRIVINKLVYITCFDACRWWIQISSGGRTGLLRVWHICGFHSFWTVCFHVTDVACCFTFVSVILRLFISGSSWHTSFGKYQENHIKILSEAVISNIERKTGLSLLEVVYLVQARVLSE